MDGPPALTKAFSKSLAPSPEISRRKVLRMAEHLVIQAQLSVISLIFLQNPCHIAVNVRLFCGHFVHVSFVFIHIPALIVLN